MGTEREFDALASDAIASSEREFFAEAMGRDDPVADESGDRSLEDMGKGLEGQHESDDEAEEGEGAEAQTEEQPEAKAEGEKSEGDKGEKADRDENGRFKSQTETQRLPPGEHGLRKELIAEREKSKNAQSDRDAVQTEFATYRQNVDREMATLKGQLTALLQQRQPQPQQQQEPPKERQAPDLWTDPEGYLRHHREQVLNEVQARHTRSSFMDARAEHGQAFDEAYAAANSLPAGDPYGQQLLRNIMDSANPGARLMSWHKQQQAMREIGNNPAAYRERVSAEAREALMKDPEFRKQVLGQIQGEARGDDASRPQSVTKLPPSLNSTRGGPPTRAPGIGKESDAELFADVMSR